MCGFQPTNALTECVSVCVCMQYKYSAFSMGAKRSTTLILTVTDFPIKCIPLRLGESAQRQIHLIGAGVNQSHLSGKNTSGNAWLETQQ